MKTFEAQILTPSGPAFKGMTDGIHLPGTEGRFQVLHSHASLMTGLDVGIVSVSDGNGKTDEFAISGGFAEVHDNYVTVLAEAAERKDKIDLDRAVDAKKRAEERLKAENYDKIRAEAALRRAVNRIKLVKS